MIEKSIHLILPLPISINTAYAGMQKRHKSNAYKVFEVEMIKAMAKYPKYKIEGDKWLSVKYIYNFHIFCKNSKKKVRDLANFEKVLSDTLSHHIKGFEDHKIKQLYQEKIESEKEFVEVFIYEL